MQLEHPEYLFIMMGFALSLIFVTGYYALTRWGRDDLKDNKKKP